MTEESEATKNIDIFNDPIAISAMNEWVKKQSHPNYLNWFRNSRHILFIVHLLLLFLCISAAFRFNLNVSHIGAAMILASTLTTGLILIFLNSAKSKVDALNYAFKGMHPARLLRRLKDAEDYEEMRTRVGLEWFQYKCTFEYDRLIKLIIVSEFILAGIGTFFWGFADIWYPDPL